MQPTEAELDAWVLATAPRAVAYARSLLHNLDEAEDVVQECYCRLLKHSQRYDLLNDGLKLLLKAVSNACINRQTRRKTWFSFSRTDEEDATSFEPADANMPAPDATLLHQELSEAVGKALKTLPQQQRAAIELKAMDYSQQEIADILGTTSNNVGVLIHRGRQTLQQLLEPYLRDRSE